MEKLTPQNEYQEHMVQVLLAKMQNVPVEEYNDDIHSWHKSNFNYMFFNTEYRIVSKSTPLFTSEKWSLINKKWNWAVMDRDGKVFFYAKKPHIDIIRNVWCVGNACFDAADYVENSVLDINTDNIHWQLSLTERPDDV